MTEKPLFKVANASPFAGFFSRLGALLIDLVLIYFVGYTLELGAREPLLELGPLLPFLSWAAAFAYFWLGNGPVGRGQTLGKAILNLRVVGADGRPLAALPAFKRTLVQFPHVLGAVWMLNVDLFRLPLLAGRLVDQLIGSIAFAAVLLHAYNVIMHPFRRGFHDLWAGSFVAPDPPPPDLNDRVLRIEDEGLRLRLARHRKFTLFFAATIMAFVLGSSLWSGVQSIGDWRRQEVFQNRLAIEGYRIRWGLLPPSEWENFVRFMQGEPLSAPGDGATTATLETQSVPQGPFALTVYCLPRWGAARAARMDDPALRARIEAIRREVRSGFDELDPFEGQIEAEDIERMAVVFADQFPFVLFSMGGDWRTFGTRPVWMAHGPIDPADGPLTYEQVHIESDPPPQNAPDGSAGERGAR